MAKESSLAKLPLVAKAGIGEITRALWPLLVEQVTEAVVAQQFAHRRPSRVTRHLLPQLQAMNFVLDDVLDEKVSVSAAREKYGVVIADGRVDDKGTTAARRARRASTSRSAAS